MKISRRHLIRLIESTLSENHNMGRIFKSDAVIEKSKLKDVVRVDLSEKSSDSKSIGSGGFFSQPQGPDGPMIHMTVIQEVNIEISGVNENDKITIDSNTPFAIEARGGPKENNAREYQMSDEKRYMYTLSKEGSGYATGNWGYLAPDGKLRVTMFMQRHEGTQEIKVSRALKYGTFQDRVDENSQEKMNEGLSRGSLYRKRYRRY